MQTAKQFYKEQLDDKYFSNTLTKKDIICALEDYTSEVAIDFLKDAWGYDWIEIMDSYKGISFEEFYKMYQDIKNK